MKTCTNCKYEKNKITEEPCELCINGNGSDNAPMKWEEDVKMKTYKTWEVIKMLTENSKLNFTNGKGVNLNIGEFGFLEGKFNDCEGLNGNINLENKWTLVQEPVTYAEAIAAWADEKKVRCVHGGRLFIYNGFKHQSMVDQKGVSITKGAIKYGKWFIEED